MNDANDKSITVLLVDDEDIILEPMNEILEGFGYKVICAISGESAVQAVKENEKIDIVVLDVLMPEMNGIDAMYRIRDIRPQIPVILASGYNYLDHIDDLEQNEWNDFIQKPYQAQNLSQKIQTVLGL